MTGRALLLLLPCLLYLSGSAQLLDESRFVQYTVAGGLSDNWVTGITQDGWGYVWISTSNGLNRFDGREFKTYHQRPDGSQLLSDDVKSVTAVGSKLLVYGNKGSQWMHLAKNRFTSMFISDATVISPFLNNVDDAVITGNGDCIQTTYTGVYVFDSTGRPKFRYDHHKSESATLGKRYGKDLFRLDDHRVLHIDNENVFAIYDSKANTYLPMSHYRHSHPVLYSLDRLHYNFRMRYGSKNIIFYSEKDQRAGVYDIAKDQISWKEPAPGWAKYDIDWQSKLVLLNDSTAIIYGTVAGYRIVHIDKSGGFHYQRGKGFETRMITALLSDREGRLWIGTRDGLFVQNIRQSQIHTLDIPLVKNSPINVPIPYMSFLRKDSLLYVGNYHQVPNAVLDANTYRFKKFISFETLSPGCNQIWNIIPYNKDTLWFSTQDGIVWFNETSGKYGRVSLPPFDSLVINHSISLLFKDSHGGIWIQSFWGSGLIHYDPLTRRSRHFTNGDKKNFLLMRVVNFVTEDREGNIWFAENGLIRWNRRKDAFDTLIQAYAGFNRTNPKIFSLCTAEDGRLLFANQNNGVLFYDPVKNSYEQVSTANGLPENSVLAALSLPGGKLWTVSRNFITVLNQHHKKKITYSYADSLPQTAFNYAAYDAKARRVLLGYDDRAVWISDDDATASRPVIPFYIDAISITKDTTILFPSGKIVLPYNRSDFTLHFSSLNFEDAQSDRYAYQLNGGEWQAIGNENSLRFNSLAPGSYQVNLKCYSSSDSRLEIIRSLEIVVKPAFWQTVWFYLILAILFIAASVVFYRWRVGGIKKKAAVEKQYAELEMKALHAQMNPHFVFNCLNGIREMILNEDNAQASKYLSKFAHLMRLTLNHSSKPFISLKETEDYLHRYLEMEQVRSNHFNYTIDIRNLEPRSTYLPPMLIQPFIENAVWHGAPALQQTLQIAIRFFGKDGYLFCEVEDDGVGIEASKAARAISGSAHHSVGISNVQQRINVLNEKYGLQASLRIADKQETGKHGTLVTVRMLIKNSRQ